MRSILIALLIVSTQAVGQTSRGGASENTNEANIGSTHAVIIGVSDYQEDRFDLKFAASDARMISEIILPLVDDEHYLVLLDDQANTGNFYSMVIPFLESEKLKPNDRLFFYFAGHGDAIDEQNSFLLLSDLTAANEKNNYLGSGTIAISLLKEKINELTLKGIQVYLIIDACRTNELPGGNNGQSKALTSIMETKKGERMLLATSPNQVSFESENFGGGHGVFTYALNNSISPSSDKNNDFQISFKELTQAIQSTMDKEMMEFGNRQEPFFCCNEYLEDSFYDLNDFNNLKSNSYSIENSNTTGKRFFGINSINDTLGKDHYRKVNESINLIFKYYNNWKLGMDVATETSNEFYNLDQLLNEIPLNNSSYNKLSQQIISGAYLFFGQDKINRYIKNEDINILGTEFLTFAETANKIETILPLLPKSTGNEVNFRYSFLKARGYVEEGNILGLEILDSLISQQPNAAFLYHSKALTFYHPKTGKYIDKKTFEENVRLSIALAPNWSYPYNLLGSHYLYELKSNPDSSNLIDSSYLYLNKSFQLNPFYSGTSLNLLELELICPEQFGSRVIQETVIKIINSEKLSIRNIEEMLFLLNNSILSGKPGKYNENLKEIYHNLIPLLLGKSQVKSQDYFLKKYLWSSNKESSDNDIKLIENLLNSTQSIIEKSTYHYVLYLLYKSNKSIKKAKENLISAKSTNKHIAKSFRKIPTHSIKKEKDFFKSRRTFVVRTRM